METARLIQPLENHEKAGRAIRDIVTRLKSARTQGELGNLLVHEIQSNSEASLNKSGRAPVSYNANEYVASTSPTDAFSKKIVDLGYALALHYMH